MKVIGIQSLQQSTGVKVRKSFSAIFSNSNAMLPEDYYATIYSAEIVNTLTNLLFIALGVRGIRNCLKYGHDSIFVVSFCGCKTLIIHRFGRITNVGRSASWKWLFCLS